MAASKKNCFTGQYGYELGKNVIPQTLRIYHCDGKIKKSRVIISKMENHRKLEVRVLERGMTFVCMALLWLKGEFSITKLNMVLNTPQHWYKPLFALDQQLNISDRERFAPGTVMSDLLSTMDWMNACPVMD